VTRGTRKLAPASLRRLPTGMHGDGGGLWFQVTPSGARSWIFRFSLFGRAREMGLGSLNTVSLEEAREAALECRKLLREGRDPIEERRSRLAAARVAATRQEPTFQECAETFIAAHRAEWTSVKHAEQWSVSLGTYVYPLIGDIPVSVIDTRLVMRVLEPRWATKRETMSRVRGRIEAILGWATTRQYREGDNPARWRGHLSNLLAKSAKKAPIEHFRALPYADLPAFLSKLRALEVISARSLEFLILTAARRDEVRLAQWTEVDLERRVWVVPSERMKLGREHRVPLSGRAAEILQSLARHSPYIFPGRGRGSAHALNTMLRLIKVKMGVVATVHGFRSTFADWAAEQTDFPSEVREMALAHAVGDRVEAAYRRGDLFDKRRQLAEAWAQYCGGSEPSENVVRLAGRAG
jgi:integrase